MTVPLVPRRRLDVGADLRGLSTMIVKIRAAQMRGANRILEIQDAQYAHDDAFLALEGRLARMEAKLDQILESTQPG